MNLFIKQKIFTLRDRYNIFNEAGQPVYVVEGKLISLGAQITLYDTMGNALYIIRQRLLKLLPQYSIYSGDNLCAVIKKQLTFLKHKLEIESAVGNYTLDGDIFGWNFTILKNGNRIGAIQKVLDFGDSYQLWFDDREDPAFLSAMVIAIDHCIHNSNNNN